MSDGYASDMAKPTIPPEKLDAWRAFLVAHAEIIERLGSEMEAETGLSLNWYEVLYYLARTEDERLRMHELAESLLLSRSAATRFVERMEKAGLVYRFTCDEDRRGTFVGLTEEGSAALAAAAPLHLRGIDEHFARFVTEEEAAVIGRVMHRLAEEQRRAGSG